MRIVSIFKNNSNQAIRIPKELEFEGVKYLEISRKGNALLLQPVRPNWSSFSNELLADSDFLTQRPPVLESRQFDLIDLNDNIETDIE